MKIIQIINENVDPFLMQLILIPIISIGLGVFIALRTRIFFIAPIVTFALSYVYTKFFLNISSIGFWEIMLPTLSLIITLLFKISKKSEKEKYQL